MRKRKDAPDPNSQPAEQAYQDVKQRLEHTKFLLRASESIATTLDLTEVLRRIAREAARAVEADMSGAYLPDENDERLHVVAGYRVPADLVEAYRQFAVPIKGHPFVEQGWMSRRPAISYPPHPTFDQDLLQRLPRDCETILFVPMLMRDEVTGGIMILWYDKHRVCTDDELDLLMGLARHAGVAAENAQLFAEAERRANESEQLVRRLALVNRISMLVNSTLDLDQILQTACTEMAQAFDVGQSGVVLFDQDLQIGRVVAQYQAVPDGEPAETTIPLTDNPSMERIITTRKSLAIADVEHDPLTATIRDVFRQQVRSILIVPLIVQDQLVGTIGLDAIGSPRAFTAEEQRLAETIANQVALAIENAQRYRHADEALEQRVQELTVLQRINRDLTTLDLDQVLFVLLQEAIGATGSSHGNVVLRDMEKAGQFRVLVSQGYAQEEEGALYAQVITKDGKGVSARIIRNGQPVITRDVREEPIPVCVKAETRSALAVPISYSGAVEGVINLRSLKLDAFHEENLAFVQVLADQASVAIHNSQLFARTRQALSKLETAHEAQERLLHTVQALSSPVIPIFGSIIVLPLIGSIDSARALRFTESLLEGITAQAAQVALIDITGMPVVDTSVANYLLRAASAARLLGCQVVLVGIRPEVAQTMVQLGVDLTGITTRVNLQGGVEYALGVVGKKLAPLKQARSRRI